MQKNGTLAEYNDREIVWIYEKLFGRYPYGSTGQLRTEICNHTTRDTQGQAQVSDLAKESVNYLLPLEDLSWIERSNKWQLRQFIFGWGLQEYARLFTHEEVDLYEFVIKQIDLKNFPLPTKKIVLNRLRSDWSKHLEECIFVKWLDRENEAQITWTWGYINKFFKNKLFSKPVMAALNIDDKYYENLSILDSWPNEDAFKLWTNIKQAWTQQKYREKLKTKDQKQSTYVLKTKTKSNLEKLAIERNVNINQMLEFLINAAYKDLKAGKLGKLEIGEED